MKFKLDPSIQSLSGTTKNSQLIYMYLRGQQVARARSDTNYKGTPEQRLVLTQRHAGNEPWRQLPAAVREVWHQWAQTFSKVCPRTGVTKNHTGRDVYLSATTYLVRLGMEPPSEPPVPLSRPSILTVEELGADDPHTFRFRITAPPVPEAVMNLMPPVVVLIRTTKGTPSLATAPYLGTHKYIRGANSLSSGLLVPGSETILEFTDAGNPVEPGERFGIEALPVRLGDGICGTPVFADVTRMGLVGTTSGMNEHEWAI